jgi:hypothetical protein
MKRIALAVLLFIASIVPAAAQTYYDIDVDLPAYPEMLPVPDSPVYYAPGVDSNYFFYDGQYWDYNNDGWYTSAWYNGPWQYVDPIYVPTYVLWVPIHYYHRPPHYFRGWNPARPPRWGEHWGRDWQNRHNAVYGNRGAQSQARAPLPAYQRQFTRDNYPRAPLQQQQLHQQHYRYQSQRPQPQQAQSQPSQQGQQQGQQARGSRPDEEGHHR